MKKALYLDVETTGLNPYKHDVIQIAALVEINGEVKEEFEAKLAPFDYAAIDPKALGIHGYTVDALKTFPHPREVHGSFCSLLSRYIDKFNRSDKFCPVGYNVRFDVDFMKNFFDKCGDKYFGSWFNWKLVDPLSRLYELDYERKIALPDYKLSTVCTHFNIPLKAHDALSDIRATRELRLLLSKL